jgi:shikimate dehydrogenase/3-dehydroquinate dehydratase type I
MTRVAAVLTAGDVRTAERDGRAALARGADLVEIRFDHVRGVSAGVVRHLASAFRRRAIATVRSPSQGGGDAVAPDRRGALVREIAHAGFPYVDLERDSDGALLADLRRRKPRGRPILIVSHHFPDPVPPADAEDALEACAALGDVAKVAMPVASLEDSLALVDLARSHGRRSRRAVVIGMGDPGIVTRVLAEDAGQEIQYAALARPSAPGQLALPTALRLRGRAPIVLGLVGHPLGHSISPTIHEAALDAARAPAAYVPFDVPADSLRTLLDAPDRLRLRGLNVTIPHKEAIADLVDELDGDAEALHAVNTVVVADGWTKGHNTDVYGFRIALRSLGVRTGGRSTLVVGAGGAAKAVVHVLLREGARVAVTNRTPSRAEALAEDFDEPVDVLEMDDLQAVGPWDLLVNATPAGMEGVGGGPPVPEGIVRRAAFVFDLVYNPAETPLLAAARRAGVPGTSGLPMLLHQAAKAYELWLGAPADMKAMESAATEALR